MANNTNENKSVNKSKQKGLSQEQIIGGFNQLRQDQRQLANKIMELETDLTEHKLVIEALDEVKDKNRKCFRMIGGVLVERTVSEVLPSLQKNQEMIKQLIETLKSQVVSKGKEISDYMDKHNIQIRQDPIFEAQDQKQKDSSQPEDNSETKTSASSSFSVLVDSQQN